MAWMSPASARIWIPLGASISKERVGDSNLGEHRGRADLNKYLYCQAGEIVGQENFEMLFHFLILLYL